MRDQIFINGEYYHIYNRGTDKRSTYLRDADYRRFLSSMAVFNCDRRISGSFSTFKACKGEKIVRVVAYCLMPNHFHLILQQVQDGGISKYLQKLLTGYTMYFNKCHQRSGVLFQGVFKSKHVSTDSYLLHLSRYVHLNPLDLLGKGSFDFSATKRFLLNYRWSSFSEYINESNDTVDDNGIIIDQTGGGEAYREFVFSAITDNSEKDKFWRFRLQEMLKNKAKSDLEAKPPKEKKVGLGRNGGK